MWHLALCLCLHAAHTYLGKQLLACPRAYCSPILCAYALCRGFQWNAVCRAHRGRCGRPPECVQRGAQGRRRPGVSVAGSGRPCPVWCEANSGKVVWGCFTRPPAARGQSDACMLARRTQPRLPASCCARCLLRLIPGWSAASRAARRWCCCFAARPRPSLERTTAKRCLATGGTATRPRSRGRETPRQRASSALLTRCRSARPPASTSRQKFWTVSALA